MTAPIWLTKAGNLGIIPEEEYYEFIFDAYNPGGGSLTYSLISGNLPTGLELENDGTVAGIPIGKASGVPTAVNKVTTSTFTIRITNSSNLIADRTFNLTVAGILPQIITPLSTSLGTYIDGTYFYADINTIEPNSTLTSKFSIISGSLPPGVTLNEITGVISGYITPIPSDTLSAFSGVFDANNVPYDSIPFNPSGTDLTKNYQFIIKADNGINIETKTYTVFVIASSSVTADNLVDTAGPSDFKADAVGIITADLSTKHNPVILSESGTLANLLQNSNIQVQIVAKDFDGDDLTFQIVSGSLPVGLNLDTNTGWIRGFLSYTTLRANSFTFSVNCFKTSDPVFISETKEFTIKVLGQIPDILTWETESDLGILYTGQISELEIRASVPSGRNLQYTLTDNFGALPYGLQLNLDGLIIGRVSFSTFIVDSRTTTFDNNETTFDRTYTFTVTASDVNNYVYETKQFTIRVIDLDEKPYENLYLKAFPNQNQRSLLSDLMDNDDIFPSTSLYRPSDPWFGKNEDRRALFLAGLNPRTITDYINAMTFNHYWKNITFGDIKTARALDSDLNVKYEVVYVELIDNQVNAQGLGPNLAVTLPENSAGISTIYPNSFTNMATRIENNIGYQNRFNIPLWMTSRQEDGTELGFIRAYVLCYTLPGKSAEIAFRLRAYQQNTQTYGLPISFEVDRYLWDASLSSVYNKENETYFSNVWTDGSGLITANTQSNIVLCASSNITCTGTIFGNANSYIITGNNTVFHSELELGSPIYVSSILIGNVASIRSNTVMTLSTLPPPIFISNSSFVSKVGVTKFIEEINVNDTILVGNVIIGTVKTITSNTNLTLYSNSISNVNTVSFSHTYTDPVSLPGEGDKYLKYPKVGVIS